MLRRLFHFSYNPDEAPQDGAHGNGSAGHAVAVAELTNECAHGSGNGSRMTTSKSVSFEQIYQGAAVKPSRIDYGILKAADMVNSPHLSGMSPEAKRCSLLMALEAARVEIEDLLQDAVVRQRALNDYEDAQQRRLKEFEAAKTEENSKIQAELDRLTREYMSRIQANLDEVARTQDSFRDWQKQKQHESQRITEAATFCVPQGSTTNGASLTAVLERATTSRR